MFAADDEDDESAGGIDKVSIDELTNPDIIEMALEEFHTFSPNGAKALIDERDAYLAHGVIDRNGITGNKGRNPCKGQCPQNIIRQAVA